MTMINEDLRQPSTEGQSPAFVHSFHVEVGKRRLEEALEGAAFPIGERVLKEHGDYTFEGEVVAVFLKRQPLPSSPPIRRYVVEDDRGLLFIFNEGSLRVKLEHEGGIESEESQTEPEAPETISGGPVS